MAKSKNKKKDDDQQFPGYPKYPGKEDITVQNNRVSIDDDGIPANAEELAHVPSADEDQIIRATDRPTESDVTREDLEALGPENLSMDMGDDEDLLKHRSTPVDFAGEDLDVPGAELDDADESIGSEDEENNPYSLGGDTHEDLDERHSL
jgi:hypothetical protein